MMSHIMVVFHLWTVLLFFALSHSIFSLSPQSDLEFSFDTQSIMNENDDTLSVSDESESIEETLRRNSDQMIQDDRRVSFSAEENVPLNGGKDNHKFIGLFKNKFFYFSIFFLVGMLGSIIVLVLFQFYLKLPILISTATICFLAFLFFAKKSIVTQEKQWIYDLPEDGLNEALKNWFAPSDDDEANETEFQERERVLTDLEKRSRLSIHLDQSHFFKDIFSPSEYDSLNNKDELIDLLIHFDKELKEIDEQFPELNTLKEEGSDYSVIALKFVLIVLSQFRSNQEYFFNNLTLLSDKLKSCGKNVSSVFSFRENNILKKKIIVLGNIVDQLLLFNFNNAEGKSLCLFLEKIQKDKDSPNDFLQHLFSLRASSEVEEGVEGNFLNILSTIEESINSLDRIAQSA